MSEKLPQKQSRINLRRTLGIFTAAVAVGSAMPAAATAKESVRVHGAREVAATPSAETQRDVTRKARQLQSRHNKGLKNAIDPAHDVLWSTDPGAPNDYNRKTSSPLIANVDGAIRYFRLDHNKVQALPLIDLSADTGPIPVDNAYNEPLSPTSDPDGVKNNVIVTSRAIIEDNAFNVPTAHVEYRNGDTAEIPVGQTTAFSADENGTIAFSR